MIISLRGEGFIVVAVLDVDGLPFEEDLLSQLHKTPMQAPRFPSQFSGLESNLFIVFFIDIKIFSSIYFIFDIIQYLIQFNSIQYTSLAYQKPWPPPSILHIDNIHLQSIEGEERFPRWIHD